MSFLDVFGTPGEDPPERSEAYSAPAWFGPPAGELGAYVSLGLVIARSERGVVAISHAIGYTTGVGFELVAQARDLSYRETQRLFHEQHLPFDPDEPAAGFLRVGLELADGVRLSNLGGRRHWPSPEDPPPGPILMAHGGGGGMSSDRDVLMRPGFWLWPVPEPGTIRLSCEWPLVDIPLSSIDLDGEELREACGRARTLWPDQAAATGQAGSG
jgi:hypothetical protein